jgi:steroid 5-alpha reductase family enzyme
VSALALVLIATAALCVGFAALYAVARRMDNYGIVDIAWSYAFGALALFYALAAPGWPTRRLLIAGIALLWSLRLGTHLYIRVIGHHPIEDGRYQEMRRRWATNFAQKMAVFFQQQALSVVLLGLPFLLAARNPAPRLHPLEIAGAALWLIAILGEALADAQLTAFKRNPANKGRVCDAGLWAFSRHPNYFFEWCVWVAFFVFACASPWGWLSVICPAAMLYLLLRVTGIPLTEEQSIRSRGDAYRAYQRRVSAFVPWFPKKS